MKIAFVGKGGSGKSTLSSLFIRSLQNRGQEQGGILAIDADLNMNLSGLLGVTVAEDRILARPDNADAIRTHLMGDNPRIASTDKFLPTTPPGQGSNLITRADDPALASYAVTVPGAKPVQLLTVGTYDRDGIGQSCYHTHLFVAENILSHSVTGPDMTIVADMVAGTDAFAYSLHLQFDAIILVVEPTPESAEVCALYLGLAREAGVEGLIHLVGNKIEDQDDLDFIAAHTGRQVLGYIPYLPVLKKSRQRGEMVTTEMLGDSGSLMQAIENAAKNPAIGAGERLQMLYQLHHKLNAKQWVQQGYGDVMAQIDPDFKWEKAA